MFVSKFFEGVVPGATAAGVAEAEELGKVVGPKVGTAYGRGSLGGRGVRCKVDVEL